MQKVMYERIDRDHGFAGFEPNRSLIANSDQQGRKRHRQDLVGHAVDVTERTNQGFLPGCLQGARRRAYGGFQLAVDPANEVTAC